jgi:methyltransferase-like protein 6
MALMFIAVYKCEVLCFSAQVGCGVGNTIFPLLAEFPQIFLHACDFSPRAVNLVKAHQEYSEQRVNAFVCDVTAEDLSAFIAPSSVDVVTLVRVLNKLLFLLLLSYC